jgi:hypothetical protein
MRLPRRAKRSLRLTEVLKGIMPCLDGHHRSTELLYVSSRCCARDRSIHRDAWIDPAEGLKGMMPCLNVHCWSTELFCVSSPRCSKQALRVTARSKRRVALLGSLSSVNSTALCEREILSFRFASSSKCLKRTFSLTARLQRYTGLCG